MPVNFSTVNVWRLNLELCPRNPW